MRKVVADTNVLISAVISAGAPRDFMRRCFSRDVLLLTSPAILSEYLEVLRRPKFRLTEAEVHLALALLVETAEVVEPSSDFHAVRDDPDDDAVLHAAVDGRADFIVSGDRHLLTLKEFSGIPILRVAEFLALRPE